jgi:hypothetical protein
MKKVDFEILSPIGMGITKKAGTLMELLENVPYLIIHKIIPPINIINDILLSGKYEAGMSGGCSWSPFQIDSEEYNEIVSSLIASDSKYIKDKPPEWVHNYSEWHIWVMEKLYDIPAEEHLRLTREYDNLNKLMLKAKESGDEALTIDLHLKAIEVGNELSEYFMKHKKIK